MLGLYARCFSFCGRAEPLLLRRRIRSLDAPGEDDSCEDSYMALENTSVRVNVLLKEGDDGGDPAGTGKVTVRRGSTARLRLSALATKTCPNIYSNEIAVLPQPRVV